VARKRPGAGVERDFEEAVEFSSADSMIGLARWRAKAEMRRRELERKLSCEQLDANGRLLKMRWLRNLEGREAWLAARLEHTTAMRRMVIEALGRGEGVGPVRSKEASAPGLGRERENPVQRPNREQEEV
jgi:hypothetical protein